VRLYDPARRPADWTGVIRPGQFAVFAKIDTTGVPCDEEGSAFATAAAASCAIFDAIDEARAFCEAAVERHPRVRFDIFDGEGRTRPPLLTVVHPSRASALDTAPREMRRRGALAWALIGVGAPLIVYAYVEAGEHDIILPAVFGVYMILFGARLLWMNLALRETEREREARLARAAGTGRRQS
jgi:hypothetical protein